MCPSHPTMEGGGDLAHCAVLPCAEVEVCGTPAPRMSFGATAPAALLHVESVVTRQAHGISNLFIIVASVTVPVISDVRYYSSVTVLGRHEWCPQRTVI